MELFRISRKKYIRDLSGEGARKYGGRWNRKGVNVIYTSSHESLAALEVLVHSSINDLPTDLEVLTLSVPDHVTVEKITESMLPENWKIYPAPRLLGDMGTDWALSKKSLLLKVPSVIIPTEYNFLINPAHPDFSKINISKIRPFSFDHRLLEKQI